MKVITVFAGFPADSGHLTALATSLDLAVYGSEQAMPNYQPAPPASVTSRTFTPIDLRKRGHLWWVYPGLFDALDEDRPDIVHVVSEPWGLLAIQLALWARSRSFTGLVVHGCDQLWAEDTRINLKRFTRQVLARQVLSTAGGFAGENQGAVRQARLGGLRPGSAAAVIHTNPRDPKVFRPPADRAEQEDARAGLGLPTDGVGVGFMGRLVPEKGVGLFVSAMRSVQAQAFEPPWAAVAGSGPLEAELCRDVSNGIRLLGSLTFPDQAAEFFRAIDVFVHPTWGAEGFLEQGPRVLIEAMLSGCSIVVTDSGANTELLGGIGHVVPEKDQPAIELAIAEAVSMARGGRRGDGREWALSEFSDAAAAGKLSALWNSVLSSGRGET